MRATETPAPPATPWRGRGIALRALQVLLAGLVIYAGAITLLPLRPGAAVDIVGPAFDDCCRNLAGLVEQCGAAGPAFPRLVRFAAVWLAGVVVAAVVTHLDRPTSGGPGRPTGCAA